jgi:hypothetical protein
LVGFSTDLVYFPSLDPGNNLSSHHLYCASATALARRRPALIPSYDHCFFIQTSPSTDPALPAACRDTAALRCTCSSCRTLFSAGGVLADCFSSLTHSACHSMERPQDNMRNPYTPVLLRTKKASYKFTVLIILLN